MTYKSSTIKSKWKKTKWLLKEAHLRKYVPTTLLFSKSNLTSMLSTYSTVFFKPTSSSGGNNIVRIKRKRRGYQTQYNTVKTTYMTKDKLYRGLNRFAGKKNFLLQKGIRLSKSNGKPFDIRVMVQKMNKGHWVSTGLVTKIGKPNKVATNYNQGGTMGHYNKTMARSGFNSRYIRLMENRLKKLGVSVGRNFDRHYKGFKELGLDVAVDQSGRPWILEVNTRPQIYPIKNLKDKSLYYRILSYSRQYGRTR